MPFNIITKLLKSICVNISTWWYHEIRKKDGKCCNKTQVKVISIIPMLLALGSPVTTLSNLTFIFSSDCQSSIPEVGIRYVRLCLGYVFYVVRVCWGCGTWLGTCSRCSFSNAYNTRTRKNRMYFIHIFHFPFPEIRQVLDVSFAFLELSLSARDPIIFFEIVLKLLK